MRVQILAKPIEVIVVEDGKAEVEQRTARANPSIDVSSSLKKEHSSILSPGHIRNIRAGKSSNSRARTVTPSSISLSRPSSSSGVRYSKLDQGVQLPDPSQVLLPFLDLTNSLHLHLKLNVLANDERIITWCTGSYTMQSNASPADPPFRLQSMNKALVKNQLQLPAYLLLTTHNVYFFRPLFRLVSITRCLEDEQTSYANPRDFVEIFTKMDINELVRVDVGLGRQYLAFHDLKNSASLVFHTRSSHSTTLIVDGITTMKHDGASETTLNQDLKFCIRILQTTILLRPGIKSTSILNYKNAFEGISFDDLNDLEFDRGIDEIVSSVDFDFVKGYILGGFLRYHKPLIDTDARGVEILHITILGTRDYLYLMEERFDIWPPAVSHFETKGHLVDVIPQYELLGVGRLSDVSRVERRRSWKIDQSLPADLQTLGRTLQNGHLGYLGASKPHLKQQATTSGWLWWVRILFGSVGTLNTPAGGYWWDLVFSNSESSDSFIEMLKQFGHPNVEYDI